MVQVLFNFSHGASTRCNNLLSLWKSVQISNQKDMLVESKEWKKEKKNYPVTYTCQILTHKRITNRRKGIVEVFQTQRQMDSEVVLFHSCRETSLGHRGTQRLGNQALLCLVWTARLEKCSAVEALCTHERTLWKDIRFRWEEEAKRAGKKKGRSCMVRALIWLLWYLLKTTVDFVLQAFIFLFIQGFNRAETNNCFSAWVKKISGYSGGTNFWNSGLVTFVE